MREHYKTTVMFLDSKSIVPLMYQEATLTLTEAELICSKPTMSEANRKLLQFVTRKPIAMLESFLASLRRTQQNHVYALLVFKGRYP